MELGKITDYLDNYLDIDAFHDDSANGLQVENTGTVEKIGLAVDACHEAIVKAGSAGCTLLVVHHGLFWGTQELVLGYFYNRIRALIEADIALYAAHLPLDGHHEVGHNIQIAKKVGLNNIEPFAQYYGKAIGVKGSLQDSQRWLVVWNNLLVSAAPFCNLGLKKLIQLALYQVPLPNLTCFKSSSCRELICLYPVNQSMVPTISLRKWGSISFTADIT
jgi:hypothetical protein